METKVKLADIQPHPKNYNKHSAGQIGRLAESLRTFGQPKPIVIWNGLIIAGHGLVEAAKRLGWETLRAADMSEAWNEAQAVAFVGADNELARLADPDEAALAALVSGLDAQLAALAAGTEERLKELLATLKAPTEDPGPQIDKAEELQEKWGIETGQLWQLGEHRLICGDCTDAAVVARVMGGEKADMIFTDPPYGHSNNNDDLIHNWEAALGKPKTASSAARPIANDKPEDAARLYSAFLRTATELLKPGCCCCCCCSGGGGPDPQFARWTIEMDQVIGFKMAVVWDKGGLGMGWHYRRNYEFVLVAEKPGAACHWFGGNSVANVIRDIGKIIPSSEQHPTEKPVELPQLFIQLHSQPGEIVWEPFSGSGSTLIAAEKTGRRCRAIEISPAYCAVAIERWAVMTGGTPELMEAVDVSK